VKRVRMKVRQPIELGIFPCFIIIVLNSFFIIG